MGNWITVALIGAASAWAMVGCGSRDASWGAWSDAGQRPRVCGESTAITQAATIHVTRSTNSPELTVTIFCDGSAQRTLGEAAAIKNLDPMPKTYYANSPEVVTFLTDLDAVGDVTAIPASPANANLRSDCSKSVSFGTVTTITAQGKTSGDMQCIKDPTPGEAALAADCRVLAPWP